MTYKANHLPQILKPILDKWDQENQSFYIGPENLFLYQGKKLQYQGNYDISTLQGSWFAKSLDYPDEKYPDLTANQIKDIATGLIRSYVPLSWSIILDYRCNYSCPMCPFQGQGYVGDYWTHRQQQRRVVPKAEAFAIINKLANNGVKKVTLTSPGELFLYPDWEEVSRYAAAKGMVVTTITNGSLIDEPQCQRMKAAGIKEVSVSLDAVSYDVYAKVRSAKQQYYQAAMEAPRLLKKHGMAVNVHFVRQVTNLHEKDDFIHHWRNTEIDSITIGSQTEYHDGYSVNKMGLTRDKFIPGFCSWYGNFVILADGTVTACCEMQILYQDHDSHGLPKINFLAEPYELIIDQMNQLMSREDSPLQPSCQKCAMYSIPFVEQQVINGWTVSYRRGEELWRRGVSLQHNLDLQQKVNEMIYSWNEGAKRVLIYGAGAHTRELFSFTDISKANIIGIVDSNLEKQGKEYFGFKIIPPEQIKEMQSDVVLISSKAFQEEICEQLNYLKKDGIELIRIYSKKH